MVRRAEDTEFCEIVGDVDTAASARPKESAAKGATAVDVQSAATPNALMNCGMTSTTATSEYMELLLASQRRYPHLYSALATGAVASAHQWAYEKAYPLSFYPCLRMGVDLSELSCLKSQFIHFPI